MVYIFIFNSLKKYPGSKTHLICLILSNFSRNSAISTGAIMSFTFLVSHLIASFKLSVKNRIGGIRTWENFGLEKYKRKYIGCQSKSGLKYFSLNKSHVCYTYASRNPSLSCHYIYFINLTITCPAIFSGHFIAFADTIGKS